MHSFHKQENKLRGYFLHREYKFSFTCTENEKVNRLSLVFNKLTYLINLTSNRLSDENLLQTLGWGCGVKV